MGDRATELHDIRDLISSAPLQEQLLADSRRWHQLCDGLDAITDRADEPGRFDALNEARDVLGIECAAVADGEDVSAALDAGLVAVRAELEERINARYDQFAAAPLAGHLDPSDQYAVEKVGEVVRAFADGRSTDPIGYNTAFLVTLREKLAAVADGITDRGYDIHVRSDVDDAVHVLEQVEAAVGGTASVDLRSLEILVREALPGLLTKTGELADEIDEDVARQRDGWRS